MHRVAPFFVSLSLLACIADRAGNSRWIVLCVDAMMPYGRCPEAGVNNPQGDGIAFVGHVVAVKPIKCGVQIRVNVTRSSAPSLPSMIDIDVSTCMVWGGAIGDSINAVVSGEPMQTGVYAPRPYCKD